MKKITANQLRKRIEEEMSYNRVEQIHVTYCCPALMGGYKKEDTQTFSADADEVVKAIYERGSKIAIGKMDAAYTEDDFRMTLFIDIVELQLKTYRNYGKDYFNRTEETPRNI